MILTTDRYDKTAFSVNKIKMSPNNSIIRQIELYCQKAYYDDKVRDEQKKILLDIVEGRDTTVQVNYCDTSYSSHDDVNKDVYQVIDGFKHGYRICVFQGYVVRIDKYVNGKLTGYSVEWYPTTDTLKSVGSYEEDLPVGKSVLYSRTSGELQNVKVYDNDGIATADLMYYQPMEVKF
jgi:antitoxin component YwqK of YwqJK toxin-antitoxin module